MENTTKEIVEMEQDALTGKKQKQGRSVKRKRKVSKTWEAAMRLKGSLVVYDPKFLL